MSLLQRVRRRHSPYTLESERSMLSVAITRSPQSLQLAVDALTEEQTEVVVRYGTRRNFTIGPLSLSTDKEVDKQESMDSNPRTEVYFLN